MRRVLCLNSSVLASVICLCSGLCVSFSFWPYRTGFLAYFVLIPFIIFSGLKDGRGKSLINSYLFGFGYFMGSLYWIAMLQKEQITLPWLRLPAAIILCLYLSLFMLLTGYLVRRLVMLRIPYEAALACVWGGVEYLRSLGPLGFPWVSLGYSQTPYASVIQQAAAIGTYGLSAWVVLLNGLLARFIVSRRWLVAVLAAAVFALPVLGGRLVLSDAKPGASLAVALIQPDISGAIKWDTTYRDSTMRILRDMTLETSGARMVIWPETAVPMYVKQSDSYIDSIIGLARTKSSYILTGFPDYERTPEGIRYYNSAMLVSPEGEIVKEYRKIHLVPFGEMIPFEDRISVLGKINFGEGDFSPGKTCEVFPIGSSRFGVAICFESIYPSLVRQYVRNGASFIVNITNDEWFGDSPGPYQHAQMAIMRCVEYRIGLARCANTGVSMLVDPYGRVIRETHLFTRDILAGQVMLGGGGTPYSKWGYMIDFMLIIVPVALAILTYVPAVERACARGETV